MKIFKLLIILIFFNSNALAQKYLMSVDVKNDSMPSRFGNKRTLNMAAFIGYGLAAGKSLNNPPSDIKYGISFSFRYGVWLRYKVNKYYSLGSSIEYYREEYNLKNPIITDSSQNFKIKYTRQISNNSCLTVFNRVNFIEDYFYVETGAFCAYDFYPKIITKSTSDNSSFKYKKTIYTSPNMINRINYGLEFKVTYGFISTYLRYRISGVYKDKDYDLPKFSIGLLTDLKD